MQLSFTVSPPTLTRACRRTELFFCALFFPPKRNAFQSLFPVFCSSSVIITVLLLHIFGLTFCFSNGTFENLDLANTQFEKSLQLRASTPPQFHRTRRWRVFADCVSVGVERVPTTPPQTAVFLVNCSLIGNSSAFHLLSSP